MKSQRLIIDTIKGWSQDRLRVQADVINHEVDYAKLWLVTSEPEYYGAPEFEVIVLWANEANMDEHPEWHERLHQLVRSYVHHLKATTVSISHKGLTTYCKLKAGTDTTPCGDFNWVDVIAPKPDVI